MFFGGKGGVGKTTCAAARAVAEAARGRRVLVVSTDPAHSLRDVLGTAHRSTRGRPSLHTIELDARRAFARWLGQHRRALGDVLEQGTWLDREDVDALVKQSIPGLDELAGLEEILRLSQSGDADTIVVDTAPTGHTLRLFAAPATVAKVAALLDTLHARHRLIRDELARVGRPEASDRLIARLAEDARAIAERFRDPRTAIVWVSLAEELAVRETADALAALEAGGLTVGEVVINRVLPPGAPCPLCDRRRTLEPREIAAIRRMAGRRRRIRVVYEEAREPTGMRALAKIGRALVGAAPGDSKTDDFRHRWSANRQPRLRSTADVSRSAAIEHAFDALVDAKLLFIGGKGGVGKTTVAAAAALRLARMHPERRVLLMSTDPAHSLGDVFDAPAGDEPAAIRRAPANLRVRELDAARALAVRRAALEAAVDELSARFGGGGEPARVSDLVDLAPPGVDELFGMLSIFAARDEFDAIVVDTAPTGHALRLLEMPGIVQKWVQVLMRMLLKYRAVVAPGSLAAELVDLSRSIRELRTSLTDASYTRFVVVTRMAGVPAAETARLLDRLRRMKLAVPAVVANAMTLAPGRCPRCRRIAAEERRRLAELQRTVRRTLQPAPRTRRAAAGTQRPERCAIIQTPLTAPPPRGARALERWERTWLMPRTSTV